MGGKSPAYTERSADLSERPGCTDETCACGWTVKVRNEGDTSYATLYAFGAKLSETPLNDDGVVTVRVIQEP
ncbi:hypothetical protein [Streptomyces sp. NPDC001340]